MKVVDFMRGQLGGRASPGCGGVTAEDREHGARGDGGVVPCGFNIERNIHSALQGELFQLEDVGIARAGTSHGILIRQLDADDGAAVLPVEPVELLANLREVFLDVGEEDGIVAPGGSFGQEPVGETAIAQFSVTPGADADDEIHAVFGAELDKGAEVAAAGPIELAFDLLLMNPDDVGGDDLNAGGLHLEDFFFPLGLGIARVVKLSHDGQPGSSIEGEEAAVERDGATVGRGGGASVIHHGGGGGVRLAGIDVDQRGLLRVWSGGREQQQKTNARVRGKAKRSQHKFRP